jgi:peroxiredoxin
MKRLALSLLWLPAFGCRLAPVSADAPVVADEPDEPVIAATRSVEVVELSIPLFGGGAVELERFRGRVVVLEVSASYAQGWGEVHEHYRRLLDGHGDDDLSIITVSLDMEPAQLASWERDPPPFTLGWDPQGALAARLGVTRFPTVFVLDREGRVIEEIAGFSDELVPRLEQGIRSVIE